MLYRCVCVCLCSCLLLFYSQEVKYLFGLVCKLAAAAAFSAAAAVTSLGSQRSLTISTISKLSVSHCTPPPGTPLQTQSSPVPLCHHPELITWTGVPQHHYKHPSMHQTSGAHTQKHVKSVARYTKFRSPYYWRLVRPPRSVPASAMWPPPTPARRTMMCRRRRPDRDLRRQRIALSSWAPYCGVSSCFWASSAWWPVSFFVGGEGRLLGRVCGWF